MQAESHSTIHITGAITLDSVSIDISATVWDISTFAPEWFAEALAESRNRQGPQARRREILFAVCCAESYLFEWIRDEVLKRDFSKLSTYFKPGIKDNVLTKWKKVPKQLAQAKLIQAAPHFHNWGEFCQLVNYRNGLVHGVASRPQTFRQPPDIEKPVPSKATLDALSPGWAVGVVVTLVQHLHNAAGTHPPTWLVHP